MREEYEKDKVNFLPSDSNELHPTFQVDGVRFTWAQYDKRTPGRFKIECKKDKIVALCSKMYCSSDITEEEIKYSCKGIQHQNNNITYKRFENVLLHGVKDTAINKGFRYVDSGMKSYEQQKKGLSYCYHKRKVAANGIDTTPLDI